MKIYILIFACFSLFLGCSSSPDVSSSSGTYTYPKETITINQDSSNPPAPSSNPTAVENSSQTPKDIERSRASHRIKPRQLSGSGATSEQSRREIHEKDLLPPSRGLSSDAAAIEKPVLIEEDDDIAAIMNDTNVHNFDIPIVFNDTVKYYITFFTTEKRKVFSNWLRRSKRYVPMITEILRKNNLPEDLVYLAMIESGFNPKAYSIAKACGPWQFIYETGGRYGLKVNYWVDERRDPEKSTVAAAKYLGDLFNQFGHWYLAAAGYNAGEKRVERAIEKHNTNDFWELSKYNALPRETRNYIPQLIAAAIIAKDPEKYGFGNIVYDQALRFTEIKVPPSTPLSFIARASSLDIDSVRSYNPELIRGITPPGSEYYEIKLPHDTNKGLFIEKLEAYLENGPRLMNVVSYKVKKKDTLAKITKKFHIKADDLQLVNNCEETLNIKPGMVISIPRFSGSSKTLVAKNFVETDSPQSSKLEKSIKIDSDKDTKQPANTKRVAKKEDKNVHDDGKTKETPSKIFHLVKKGDTLSSISERYGIDVSELKSINRIKGETVKLNTKLRLVKYIEKKSKPKIKYHLVRKGDTLASISEKYGVDIDNIKSANRLKGNKIQARMKLKIPVTG